MTTDNGACQTPIADHIARAIDLMQRGARMRLDAIPGDSSMLSSMFGPDVTAEIAKRLTAPEAKSEVTGWVVLRKRGDGIFMSAETYDEASAAAEADIHDRGYFAVSRVRSALVDPEGGV